MRQTGKRILTILVILSLVTGLPCFATQTDYILNGDFSQVSQNTPVDWALSGGASLRTPFRQPVSGSPELSANGGFENLTGGAPTGWNAYWGPWNGTNLFASSSVVHTGAKSIKVVGVPGDSMVALYDVPGTVVPGAVYQVSGWLYVSSEIQGGRGSIGMSMYNGDEILETRSQRADNVAADTWTRVVCTVRIPEECTRVVLTCSIQAAGCIYFDDVSFYMTEAPVPFTLETEDIFHYSDNETGTARVDMNNYYSDGSALVDFAVKSGDTVISEQKNVAVSQNTAGWIYGISELEMRREYVLTATVRSSVWTGELTQKIYKYPRPTCLTKEGVYMADGKPFIPVIAYWPGEFARLPEIGINVAEIGAANVETTLEKLDELDALGLKALVSLYCGPAYLYPAGHPDNIALTKQIVQAVRNHPAVFAYAVQDEPYGGIMEHMDKWLMESYKIIRDIDEAHPVYIVEFVRSCFDRAGRMADVLAVDPYPFQSNSYTITDAVQTARAAVYNKKPVYAILQTYDGGSWFPTADNIREQIYRALEEGATGIGYYSILLAKGQSTAGTEDDKALYETDRWEPMKTFAAMEMKESLAYYALRESKTFSRYYEAGHYGFYYESWVRDGDLYMVIHNRGTGSVSRTIPLTSDSGQVTINGYRAWAVSRNNEYASSPGSTLSVTLAAQEAVFYKITPNSPINASLLSAESALVFAADADEAVMSAGEANYVPMSTAEQNYVQLPTSGAKMQQSVFELEPVTTYQLTLSYKSGLQNSGQVDIQYRVMDENGFFSWTEWCAGNEKAYVTAEASYKESFGTESGTDEQTVTFMLTTPRYANALKLTISAAKTDTALTISGVTLTKTNLNLIKNGDFSHLKGVNILTGGWMAYSDYPGAFGNTVEIRQSTVAGNYLYMTEAPGGTAGRSANARQAVSLYCDTVYRLSFLYKDMGSAPEPVICLYTGGTNGHIITDWPTGENRSDGWRAYSLYIRPTADAACTIWLGSMDAVGAYAYDEVYMTPCTEEDGVFFLTGQASAVKGAGCADILQKTTSLDGAERIYAAYVTDKADYKLFLASYESYDGNKTLSDVEIARNTPLAAVNVPRGGSVRAYLWQWQNLWPLRDAVELR